MLTRVLHELETQLGMDHATLMLLSGDGDELFVGAVGTLTAEAATHSRYSRGEGITGNVLITGKLAIVPRVSSSKNFQSRVHLRQVERGKEISFICVPVMLDSEVIGTLSADMPHEKIEVLNERARVLRIVASLVAFDVKTRRRQEMERGILEAENRRLQTELEEKFHPENIIGNGSAMKSLYHRMHQVAPSNTTVLIRGESGTGKELVATALHFSSQRANKPFVKVNCSALSETLLESELFGHEAGAFTDATQTRKGRIEEANGGTLFLDEIGDFSPTIQVKLLRVLQERELQRVGSNKTINVDIRVIGATNVNLEERIKSNEFRDDFYYRINVFPLFLPPLRERKDDILLLADHFVKKYAEKAGKAIPRFSTSATEAMYAYHWPGNVRELENCIEYAILVTTDGVIRQHNLPASLQLVEDEMPLANFTMSQRIQMLEKKLLLAALQSNKGNVAAAARELGITPRIARYKVKTLGIS